MIQFAVKIGPFDISDDLMAGLYDSYFHWITGNTGYTTGSGPDGIADETWITNILKAPGSVDEVADISQGGGYQTLSGSDIQVLLMAPAWNGSSFSEYLTTKGITLGGKTCFVYLDLDGTFQLVGTFTIDGVSHGEGVTTLQAVDGYIAIHKDFPREAITKQGFPLAPDDSIDKPIPVCFGDVIAETIPLTEQVRVIPVTAVNGKEYNLTSAGKVTSKTVFSLRTGDKYFNGNALAGKLIRVVRTGNTDLEITPAEIFNNSATNTTTKTTTITLKDTLKISDTTDFTPVGTSAMINGSEVANPQGAFSYTWFEVYEFTDIRVYSKPVFGGSEWMNLLGWDSDRKEYLNIDPKIISWSPVGNAAYPDMATYKILPSGDNAAYQRPEGYKIPVNNPKYFKKAVYQNTGGTGKIVHTYSGSLLSTAEGADMPNVLDNNHESLYNAYFEINNPLPMDNYNSGDELYFGPGGQYSIGFEIIFDLPNEFSIESSEKMFASVAMDMSTIFTNSNDPINPTKVNRKWCRHEAFVSYSLIDIFGGDIATTPEFKMIDVNGDSNISNPNRNALYSNGSFPVPNILTATHYGISSQIYGDGGANPGQQTHLEIFDGILSDANSVARVKKIKAKFRIVFTVQGPTYLYNPIKLNWGFNIREIAFFRQRDPYAGKMYTRTRGVFFGDTWNSRKTADQPVQNIVDVMEYLIRKGDGRPDVIDEAAFDLASNRRYYMNANYQMDEKQNTVDWLQLLCKHAFICMVSGENGKRRPIWIENYGVADPSTVSRRLTESDLLSLGEAEKTGIDRAYTSIDIKYGWNAGLGDYTQRLCTFNEEDSDGFPFKYTSLGADVDLLNIPTILKYQGTKVIAEFTTSIMDSLTPPLAEGDYISSRGSSLFSFYFGKYISKRISGAYEIHTVELGEYTGSFDISTTSMITRHRSSIPKWTTYVTGAPNYASAKNLWDKAHAAYLRVGQKNVYTLETKLFTTFDGPNALAMFILDWLGGQWLEMTGTLPINEANLALKLMDRVGINDIVRTDANSFYHVILSRSINADTGLIELKFARREWDLPYETYLIWQDTDSNSNVKLDYSTHENVVEDVIA